MRSVSQTTQFVRDVKRMRKRGKDLEKLKFLVTKLAKNEPLDPKHRDHPLIGPWKNCRDCHIEPDWLLIYSAFHKTVRTFSANLSHCSPL